MNKLLMPSIALISLLFTACSKDETDVSPMEWTWDILTPETILYESPASDEISDIVFVANGKEGDIVLTCRNYDTLLFAESSSDSYDCVWATLNIEANKVIIHFPAVLSDTPEVSEKITITGIHGDVSSNTVVELKRTFESEENPDTGNDTSEVAKFNIITARFTPFMNIDSPLPAPLDLITFRVTDADGKYSPVVVPDFTQHYDSIVWCADDFPHTLKIYEKETTDGKTEKHFTSQWSSNFFRSGAIKTHLKGYRHGEVKYEVSLNLNLYNRDFMGIEWGTVVLQNPQNLTTYCLLDRTYEYQVNDIVAVGENPYSTITPVNHRHLSDSEFIPEARKAIVSLMEMNTGNGRDAKGKESLFKCLPEKEDIEAELYWENETTRILMLHQTPVDPDEPAEEKYYLHIEPKR